MLRMHWEIWKECETYVTEVNHGISQSQNKLTLGLLII